MTVVLRIHPFVWNQLSWTHRDRVREIVEHVCLDLSISVDRAELVDISQVEQAIVNEVKRVPCWC